MRALKNILADLDDVSDDLRKAATREDVSDCIDSVEALIHQLQKHMDVTLADHVIAISNAFKEWQRESERPGQRTCWQDIAERNLGDAIKAAEGVAKEALGGEA